MKDAIDRSASTVSKSRTMPARSAMLFWFGSSLLVWAAAVMSAVWIL